jgi:response regulator RpfG family c-di-GMP phosphodiesterase
MNIMINKECLDDLYQCLERNLGFLSSGIELYTPDKKIKNILNEKLDEIRYYIKKVYDPELIELKQKARSYYQTWLKLKDTDNKTAQAAYFEYLEIKRKIEYILIPF